MQGRDTASLSILRGINTLQEFYYQGKRVFLVADEALADLPEEQLQQLQIRDENNLIRLRDRFFDTTVPQPGVRSGLAQASGPGPKLFLVQFASTIRDDWFRDLSDREGVEIVQHVPENAYLVWAGQSAREKLAFDVSFQPHLQWVGPFHPAYKLHPAFDLSFEGDVIATLQLYWNRGVQTSLDVIQEKVTRVHQGSHRVGDFLFMIVEVPASELEAIARLEDVVNVEPFVELGVAGERQGQILAGSANAAGTGPGGPGYLAWLESLGFTSNFDFVVDITDDGLDRGETVAGSVHPIFLDANGNSRIAYIRKIYAEDGDIGQNVSTLDDHDYTGHGTMSASIVGGLNRSVSTDGDFAYHADAAGYRFGLGIAPFVRLGASKILDYSRIHLNPSQNPYLSPHLWTVYDLAYADDARISSHSFAATGCDAVGNGEYGALAYYYDRLTRDARRPSAASGGAPGNQEMVFVVAAGNLGVGQCSTPQLGKAGSIAKNTLVVGATENFNATGDTDGGGVPDGMANHMENILKMSGRGPASDGRIKPDIMAPGSHIFGAASQHPTFNGDGISGADGNDLHDNEDDGASYYPPDPDPSDSRGQTLYTWSSGTSQATPAVAGAAALLRQWFLDHGHPAPSPAMTKAYLMNSATYLVDSDLEAVFGQDDLPSNHQGMGRTNLERAFDDTPRLLFDQIKTAHATADVDATEVFTVKGHVADAAKPFRVTMAFTDAAGDANTGEAKRNDMDLTVEIGGKFYRGNDFTLDESNVGEETDPPDERNNVESVFLPAGATGEFTITVTPSAVTWDGVLNNEDETDQDFALVVYNGAFPDRNPVDIILVLDVSNSMGSRAPGGTLPKIDLLKESVEKFIGVWRSFSIPEDRMGVVFFSTSIDATIPTVPPGTPILQPFEANAGAILSAVDAQGTGGCTALGAGILTALKGFDDLEDRQRHVIVFSNGMQNSLPLVSTSSSGGLQFLNTADAICGNSGVDPELDVDLDDYGVGAIHTIGTGVDGASWATLLTEIASVTGGENHFTTTPDENLEDFFLEDLVAALRVDPVEKVTTETGTLVNLGSDQSETFEINETVRRAAFAVSWRGDSREEAVDFSLVAPNGTTVPDALISWLAGDSYRIATVDFPLEGTASPIPHAGTWRLVFHPDLVVPEVSYRAHLIVDDANLRYYFDAPTAGTGVGDPIPVSLAIQDGNRTLTGLDNVQAIITRPDMGFGTWMARHDVSVDRLRALPALEGDQVQPSAARKAHLLMQDPAIRLELGTITDTIRLFDDGLPSHGDVKAGDGVYSATYANTLRPGSYDLEVSFQYRQDQGGIAHRSDRRTMAVSMERFDLAKSTFDLRWVGDDEGGFTYEIHAIPVDGYDNYLGPGHTVEAVVVLPDDKWTGRRAVLEDNLDGSYSGRIWLSSNEIERGGGVRVDVGDRVLGWAPLPPPPVRSRWVGMHSGLAIPVGDFDNRYDRGPLVEVSVGYGLNPWAAFEGRFGRYSFDPSYEIYGGSGYLKGYLHFGGMRLHAAAGLGYFKPENMDGAIGVSPGIGLDRGITPKFRVEASARYFHLFTGVDAIGFLGLSAGATYIVP